MKTPKDRKNNEQNARHFGRGEYGSGDISPRDIERWEKTHCPNCGRPAASPSSNLCGLALMGKECA